MRNVEKLHTRSVGYFGSKFARQHISEVVLRQQYMAAFLIYIRLVVLYPKYLCGSPAGERGVRGDLYQLFSAEQLIHLLYFRLGALVAPDYRLAQHLALAVEHYKSVHLPA